MRDSLACVKPHSWDTALKVPPRDGMHKRSVPATEVTASSAMFEPMATGLEGWHATNQVTDGAQTCNRNC